MELGRRPYLLAATVALGCTAQIPVLTGVSPNPARAGDVVELEGTDLAARSPGSASIHVSSVEGGPDLDLTAAVITWEATRVRFVIPRALLVGRYALRVAIDDVPSNTLDLEVLAPPPPAITALVPPRAEAGGIVTVLGSDFGPDVGRVQFSPDTEAATLSWSEAEIIITMPDAPDSDAVRVVTAEALESEWFDIEPAALEPRLSVIQARIFTPSCALTSCHGHLPSAELSLADGDSFASLVGVPSSQLTGALRVEAYSPETSLLNDKLLHDPPAVGDRMPLGGAPLLPEQVALIEEWIRMGARDD